MPGARFQTTTDDGGMVVVVSHGRFGHFAHGRHSTHHTARLALEAPLHSAPLESTRDQRVRA